mgnify:CR=1 FL=1
MALLSRAQCSVTVALAHDHQHNDRACSNHCQDHQQHDGHVVTGLRHHCGCGSRRGLAPGAVGNGLGDVGMVIFLRNRRGLGVAEVKGVSIDEAVKMRTDAVLQEAVVPITVSVRPIEPQGKLIGFASVNFGGVVIDDFKVVDGKNGIFLGAPSKPDPASRTGYRATVRIPDRATQERINAAGVKAYHAAVEQLVTRAQAVRPAPIKEQMAEAAKQAGKENAARPAPAKAKEARNDR